MTGRLTLIGLALFATGCNAIFGLDEASERGAGGEGQGGSGGDGQGGEGTTTVGNGGGTCDPFDGAGEPNADPLLEEEMETWDDGPVNWLLSEGTVEEVPSVSGCGSAARITAPPGTYAALDSLEKWDVLAGDRVVLTGLGQRVGGAPTEQGIGVSLVYEGSGLTVGRSLLFPLVGWSGDQSEIDVEEDGRVFVVLFVSSLDQIEARSAEFDEIRLYVE